MFVCLLMPVAACGDFASARSNIRSISAQNLSLQHTDIFVSFVLLVPFVCVCLVAFIHRSSQSKIAELRIATACLNL